MTQLLYGPPINTKSYADLYGPPSAFDNQSLFSKILTTTISLILNPIFITISFIVGIILYLFTHKKIFIIIPLIFAIIFLLQEVLGLYIF